MAKKQPISAIKSALKSALKRPPAKKALSPGKRNIKGSGEPKRATVIMKDHAPGQSPWDGSEERRMVLKWRAMELKVQGYSLRDIAKKLEEEFELEKPVSYRTVDDWLDEAFAETVTAKQLDADRHLSVLMARTEGIIRRLLPVATGRFIVRRTRIRDGEEIEILDENVLSEMVAAAGEARQQMGLQAKLLKIGRAGEDEAKTGALSGHGLTLLVEQVVTQNIVFPGQPHKGHGALVLSSGDADVDVMDAEGVVEVERMEPV